MVRNSEKVHSISAENRELKFILIWDNRTSSQGSKLLLPVIKASEVKIKHQTKGIEAEQKRKKTNFFFGTQPKKNLAWAGWPKRLGLVRATPWADFAVISNQPWSTMTAIFPCWALFWKNCSLFRILVNYCQRKKRPTIWIWVQLHIDPLHRFLVPKNCTIMGGFHPLTKPATFKFQYPFNKRKQYTWLRVWALKRTFFSETYFFFRQIKRNKPDMITPQAGMGDSVSQVRRYRCSICLLFVCDDILFNVIKFQPPPDIFGVLPVLVS